MKNPILSINILAFILFLNNVNAQQLLTHYEKSNFLESDAYAEVLDFYKSLEKKSNKVLIKEMGSTDANMPLHLILVSQDKILNAEDWKNESKIPKSGF